MSFPWVPHGLFYRGDQAWSEPITDLVLPPAVFFCIIPSPNHQPSLWICLQPTILIRLSVGPLPPPKHTLLRTQLAWTTQYILWRRILQKSGGAACPVFLPRALAFRPGPSRLPFRAGMQLPGSSAAVLLEALQAWPASLLGHQATCERGRENPHKSTSTSRGPHPRRRSVTPPGRQGRYQISHMQRITGRREGVTIDDGPRADGSLLG